MFTVIIQLIFATFFMIFTLCMIWEQWNIINNDTTCIYLYNPLVIDLKQKKFLEKRDINEVINETFGQGFNYHWFLPIKVGGYKPLFNDITRRSKYD